MYGGVLRWTGGYGPFVGVVGRGIKCVCVCVSMSDERNRNRRWEDFGDTLAMLLMQLLLLLAWL